MYYVFLKKVTFSALVVFPSFLHFLIPISQCFSLILLSLFALATIEYINGDLRLDRVYDPFITLFFVYLLRKNIESIKQDIGT